MVVPLTRPIFGPEEAQAVAEVLAEGIAPHGPVVASFERQFEELFGARNAVAVSSGTAALHLALVGAGIREGDEVIVPSLSGLAAANAVRYVGATVVFADVNRSTLGLDSSTVAPMITPRTRAVIVVHHAGTPADVRDLHELCVPLGIEVIEDAASALGSTSHGTTVGGHSSFVATSFGPENVITTGEGGAVSVADRDVAARIRRLRNHASLPSPDATSRVVAPGSELLPRHRELGFSYRLSEIQGAIGRVQLRRLPLLLHRRRYLAERYRDVLARELHLTTACDPDHGTTNFHSFWVLVPEDAPTTRDALVRMLRANAITARGGFVAAHRELAYRGHPHDSLPTTDRVARTSLVLPLFHDLEEHAVDRIVDLVADAVRRPTRVR